MTWRPVGQSFIDAQVPTYEAFVLGSELGKYMIEIWIDLLLLGLLCALHKFITEGDLHTKFKEHAIVTSWDSDDATAYCKFHIHVLNELYFPVNLLGHYVEDAEASISLYCELWLVEEVNCVRMILGD